MTLRARMSCFFLSLALAAVPLTAHAAEPVPVEAFGNLPDMSQVQISPDGKHLAALQEYQGRRIAVIYEIGGDQQKVAPFAVDDASIDSITWANSERLLVAARTQHRVAGTGSTKVEFSRMVSINTDAEDVEVLFDSNRRMGRNQFQTEIVHRLPDDREHVLIPSYDQAGRFNLYKVNVFTSRARIAEGGNSDTRDWLTDHTGEARVRWDYDFKRDRQTIFIRSVGGGWEEMYRSNTGDDEDSQKRINPTEWSDHPNKAYVTSRNEEGFRVLSLFDAESRTISKEVFSHPQADVTGISVNQRTGALQSVYFAKDEPEAVHFDELRKKRQKDLDRAFPNTSVNRLYSSDDALQRHVVRTSSPSTPPIYYYLDTETMNAFEFGRAYPLLRDVPLGPVRKITYAARDGLEIPAYLTLPPDTEAKNLPTVILPHGGPASRDMMTFDYWAQFLANRGYAVLQPNFRGSTGYGRAFTAAGYGEWGGKMQDDVTDGTRYLISEGIADPDRICIAGASYGGYAALMGVVKEPDLYRCAISVNGVSDLIKMMRYERLFTGLNYWKKHIGDPRKDRDKLRAASPARHAEKIKAAVLLIHGKEDTVVEFDQSKDMARALRREDKPHKLVELDGEDHFLSFGETRIAMLRATESFLREHLGPGAR